MSELNGKKAEAIQMLKSLLEGIEKSDEVCQVGLTYKCITQEIPTRLGTVEIEPSGWVEIDINIMFKKGRA